MIKIISEGVFSAIAEAIGFGNLWEVLKGRFFQVIRGWTAIADIWKSETQEELDDAMKNYTSDIEQIKGRYRQAETEFAQNNAVFNSAYGDHLLFTNPALALTTALFEPLMDQTYRQDTRALLSYSGLDRWGLTPDFISNWIEEQPYDEKHAARTVTTDPITGKRSATDIFVYEPKNKDDKVSQIMSLFVSENVKKPNKILNEKFSKNDAKKLAVNISKAYEKAGIYDEMNKIAEQILESKKALIAEVVTPAAQTIKYLSDLMSAQQPEQFTQIMSQLSKINPKLSKMAPGDFVNKIDSAVNQIKNDSITIEKIKSDLKLTEVDDNVLRDLVFESVRNNFAQATLESVEIIYEKTIAILMEGITEKGLKAMKKTPIGKEYANLIENNIQILEKAILSLERIVKPKE